MTDAAHAQQPGAPIRAEVVTDLDDLVGRVADTVADRVADRVARAAAATPAEEHGGDRPRIVTIDGRSGTGKTSLAAAVAARLDAPVVHMDDLYPGWQGLAAALPVLADEVLIPLRTGEPARVRRWDWVADQPGEEIEVPAAPFVVVEGCGSSIGPAGQLSDLRVWLEADAGQRRSRGLARDAGSFDQHWDSWADQEAELFEADATREHADLIFDTTGTA